MGKIAFTFFLSLVSCNMINLSKTKTDYDTKILSAYDYVAEKYDDKILVSNYFAQIDIVNFAEQISKKQNKKMSIVLDSLIKVTEQNKTKKYPIKKLIGNNNKEGDLKLFFSEPIENSILVEVFETQENLNYEKLTMFGSSDVYLLLFEDKEIIDAYHIKLDYN